MRSQGKESAKKSEMLKFSPLWGIEKKQAGD